MEVVKLFIYTTPGLGENHVAFSRIKELQKSFFIQFDRAEYQISMPDRPDRNDWSFSDDILSTHYQHKFKKDGLHIIFSNIPLEGNYFTRKLSKSAAIVSFHNISTILEKEHIPLSNFVAARIYALCIRYSLTKDLLSSKYASLTNFRDDGCIFDMNAKITNIHMSLIRLKIHEYSSTKLHSEFNVAINDIKCINNELKKYNLNIINRAKRKLVKNPYWSILAGGILGYILTKTLDLFF